MRDLTNTPYKQFIWFIAEIVETNTDPNKLGRVRIRIYGFHSEDTPNDKLPLALVMNGGAARLVEKQWVVGFFLDGALAQQPFVLGTVGSAIGNPAKVSSQANPGPNQDKTRGGAIAGALVGAKVGGLPGAAIGAAVGAVVGGRADAPATPAPPSSAIPKPCAPGQTPNYPETFPSNGKYAFQDVSVPQGPGMYSFGATKDRKQFTHILVHDFANGRAFQDGAKAAAYTQSLNNTLKGWSTGYHLIVDPAGKVWQAAPLNVRTNSNVGGSTYNNNNTLNIAFINTTFHANGQAIGNDATAAQLKNGALLIQDAGNQFGIPKSNISSHGPVDPENKSAKEGLAAFNYAMARYVEPKGATIPTDCIPTPSKPPIKIGL